MLGFPAYARPAPQVLERIDLTKYDSLPGIEELLKEKGFTKAEEPAPVGDPKPEL